MREQARNSERLQNKLDKLARTSSVAPVPTLAVPAILDGLGSAGKPRARDSTFDRILAIAEDLRSEGYDTVIALPFTSDSAFSEAQEQLTLTGREVLLFLRNIRELAVRLPYGEETVWTARSTGRFVEISSDDAEDAAHIWEVRTHDGTIPSEFLGKDQRDATSYEMRVAIPEEGVDGPQKLFSYFPTQIRFPFPLIAHATLELTNNRQNLAQSKANGYLLKQLAAFMARVAADIASDGALSASDPWRPLSLITARGDLDTVVQGFEFRDALLEAAKPFDLIPVRGGRRTQATMARRLASADLQWLPKLGFEDVVVPCDDPDLLKMVEELGTPEMSEDELRERLDLASPFLSITDRATLIAELTQAYLICTKHTHLRMQPARWACKV